MESKQEMTFFFIWENATAVDVWCGLSMLLSCERR
jgi:hypothetical protein